MMLFFGIFLFAGYGILSGGRLQHDFPYGYLASDAFQHQIRAESIKDAGNYRNEASYIVMGIKNAVGYYPPVLYHLSVILSHLSGLEVYDTIYFIVFLFAAIASMLTYIIIRNFNKNVAIISLPISLLVFSAGLYTGFTWGNWPSLLSQFFLVCVFWCTSRISLNRSYLLLGIFFSANVMTHTSEALFAGVYLALFFLVSCIAAKKLELISLKNIILGGIIAFAITSHYIVIFKGVWVPRQPFVFAVAREWDNPTMYLSDFRLFAAFMILGVILSLFFIKKSIVPALSSLTMILVGMGNYYGFREKAFQLRFFWPIFISFLAGFGIYQSLKLVVREWKLIYSIAISSVFIFMIAPSGIPFIPDGLAGYANKIPIIPHYSRLETSGLMDPYHWEALKWIEKNTEEKSRIYFFQGDIYGQDAILRNGKRTHAQIIPEDFIDAIKKREIRRIYDTDMPGDGGGGAPYRKSFFSFGFALDENREESSPGKKDICLFDYYVFDKLSRQQVFAQYNILIASELQKKDFIEKSFENQVVLILKNKKTGADCIEQRNF